MKMQGTAGSVASTANPEAEDASANVNEDHVNASIAERPPPGACYFHDILKGYQYQKTFTIR